MNSLFKLCIFLLLVTTSHLSLASTEKLNNDYQALVLLFFDAVRTGNNEVVDKFLTSGFPVNQRNFQSYTALMVAAYQGQASTVHALLAHGANACLRDKRGNTALMGALIKREIKIARDLYQTDCATESRNKAGLNLQEFAKIYGQSSTLKSLSKAE